MNKENIRMHKDWIKESRREVKIYEKQLKDIDSGKVKAGRDFITALNKNGIADTPETSIVYKNPTSKMIRRGRKLDRFY